MADAFHPTKKREFGSTPHVMAEAIGELRGLKMAAHIAGKSRSMMAAYSDPDTQRKIPLDVVRAMVRAGAREPVHDMCALAGGSFVAGEPSTEPREILIGKALVEAAQVASLALQIQDKTASGCLPLLREAEELVRAAVALRERILADIEGQ